MLETDMQTILNFRTLDQENRPPWLENTWIEFQGCKISSIGLKKC